MKSSLFTGVILATLLLGAGCAGSTPTPAPVEPVPTTPMPTTPEVVLPSLEEQLAAGSWKLVTYTKGDTDSSLKDQNWSFTFKNGKMAGTLCNSMSGSFTLADEVMKFGPVMSTKKFCTGLPGEAEQAFIKGGNTGFRVLMDWDGKQLLLTNESAREQFAFTMASGEPATGMVSKIKLAQLENLTGAPRPGQLVRGCDAVTFIDRTIATTTAPLQAAMKEVFKEPQAKGATFKSVTLKDGNALVIFTGQPQLAGVCDDPRLPALIEMTAKQFSTVKNVTICKDKELYAPNEKGDPAEACPGI